jgi:UDP-glucose 4-epimerase
MEGKRVLVTGGAGFIGSNLSNTLAARNEVIALDNGYLGEPSNLDEGVEFVDGDVMDEDLPTDVDVVIHLAALSSRAMLEENPREGAKVNVEGFVNVVEQALADDCHRILYASTSSIYDDDLPSSEDDPVRAETGYEASMLSRERYAEYYNDFYDDLSVTGLRFFSVYQGYAGNESHKGEYANTVSQWAELMAEGGRPVLWGDGSQTRDFTHVSDIVRAIELLADGRHDGVFNIGTGRNFSFNEMIEMLNDALGTDIDPEYEPVPLKNYNYQQRADVSKLKAATGWDPEIDFERGVDLVCRAYLD